MATATTEQLDARVQSYIDDVMSGKILACIYVKQAIKRHIADLNTANERGLYFDIEEANLTIRFIEMLRHSKGEWAGQFIKLEPWQAFIIACVFGWKKADGTRRFNTVFISIARKNGKSTIGATVGIKLLVADGEMGADIYSAATKRDQAKIVHEEAKRMVKKTPCLQGVVQILRDTLYVESTESRYQPLGADADSTDGLHVAGAIIDELHAHKNRDLWDVLDTATGARRNPLMFGITTAGDAGDQESIYWELKEYTRQVLEGTDIQDDTWFGIIYSLDVQEVDSLGDKKNDTETDDWRDETKWIKANPNLGVSVKLDDLRRKCKRAQQSGDAIANFRRKHTNVETESSNPWILTDQNSKWSRCGYGVMYGEKGILPEAIERYKDRPCWVGGDLSSISDLTSLVFAFPMDDDFIDVVCFGWCPRENAIGRQKNKRVPYLTWSQAGLIELTEGDSVDYDCIRRLAIKARDEWRWDIQQIRFDPNNARYLMMKMIEEDGYSQDQVIEHLQTLDQMNEPISMVEKLVLDGHLRHYNHKVLRWCVSNVLIYSDTGGRKRFDKRKAREKIDYAVAMTMAIAGAKGGVGTSVYDERPEILCL